MCFWREQRENKRAMVHISVHAIGVKMCFDVLIFDIEMCTLSGCTKTGARRFSSKTQTEYG